MADELDAISDREQAILDSQVRTAASFAAIIPKGEPGECKFCGFEFVRLVRGACGRCRDEQKLP